MCHHLDLDQQQRMEVETNVHNAGEAGLDLKEVNVIMAKRKLGKAREVMQQSGHLHHSR